MGSIDRLAWMLVLLLPALAGLLACRRRLPLGPRVALEYCMGLYVLTYFLGATRLYLWQEAVVDDDYAGHGPLPIDLSWDDVLLVAALPLLIVPWFVLLLQETTGTLWRSFPQGGRIGGVALGMGAGLGFGAGIALVAPQQTGPAEQCMERIARDRGPEGFVRAASRSIFRHACHARRTDLRHLAGLRGTADVRARPRAFRSAYGGTVHGRHRGGPDARHLPDRAGHVLRPDAGLLLPRIHCQKASMAARAAHRGFRAWRAEAVFKPQRDGKTRQDSLLTFVMRMPIALPFALEMKQEAPQLVESTDSMPHELAEFMDAEFRRGERFASMALPGFVIGWMTDGAAGAIFSLALIALLVFAGGNALECAGISTRPGRGVALLSVMLGRRLTMRFRSTWQRFRIKLWRALPGDPGAAHHRLPCDLGHDRAADTERP